MGVATQRVRGFLPARGDRRCFHTLKQAAGSREGRRLSSFLMK